MEKGADTATISAETFEDWGNFQNVENNYFNLILYFCEKNSIEAENIWHVYNLQNNFHFSIT